MKQNNKKVKKEQTHISKIESTEDCLSSRGGLAFFVKYFKSIKILPAIVQAFDGLRKSRKGMSLKKILSQFFYNAVDGTSQTMSRFDEQQKDKGYLATIETAAKDAVSSHTMKRFFKAVKETMLKKLQNVLLEIFIWRLKLSNPKEIILGTDTMVLDNNDAKKREGVTPTYKKVLGYHPLLLYWGRMIINMAFHEGSEHHNTNGDFFHAVMNTVKIIRERYSKEVPIILVSDAGFFDQKYFKMMDRIGVYFICGGKLFDDIKLSIMKNTPSHKWESFEKNGISYECMDFIDKRGTWSREYRALYYAQVDENGELRLAYDRPETLIYTNLMGKEKLTDLGLEKYLDRKELVNLYHLRARDELTNRVLKEFTDEALPFKKMLPNAAYYFLCVIAHNLMVAFQTDVICGVVSPVAYPNTVRRTFFDIAAKIVRTGHMIVLKFEQSIFHRLRLPDIWQKIEHSPAFQ